MSDSLAGKVAIVTGSSRGIGKAIALGFAREGARVVVSGRTSGPATGELSIEAVVREIEAQGHEAMPIKCDVTSEADVARMTEEVLRRWGAIDVLVNNAGALWPKGLLDTPYAKWQEIMRTNLDGAYLCTMAVLPTMMEQSRGSIVNISSGRAYSEDARSTAYAASKAGLDRMTVKLATELKSKGIAVNAIDPGATLTEVSQERYPEMDMTGWRWPQEKNIVPACLFLAAQDANGLTGKILKESEFGKDWP